MVQTAIMGYGTIGSGVAQILKENAAQIAAACGQLRRAEAESDCPAPN